MPWIVVWSGVALFGITRIYRSAVGGRKQYREWEERRKRKGRSDEGGEKREGIHEKDEEGKGRNLANEHNMSVLT